MHEYLIQPCCFGCGAADTVLHYALCDALLDAIRQHLPRTVRGPLDRPLHEWDAEWVSQVFIVYGVFRAFDHRHSDLWASPRAYAKAAAYAAALLAAKWVWTSPPTQRTILLLSFPPDPLRVRVWWASFVRTLIGSSPHPWGDWPSPLAGGGPAARCRHGGGLKKPTPRTRAGQGAGGGRR